VYETVLKTELVKNMLFQKYFVTQEEGVFDPFIQRWDREGGVG